MKKIVSMFVSLMIIFSVSVVTAERLKSTQVNETIPVYNVNNGTFTYETFMAVTPYMDYNVSWEIKNISGTLYIVYTSATYISNSCEGGPIVYFASIDQAGLSSYYDPGEYKLSVTAVPYSVGYSYRTQGTRDAYGNLTFGGSASKNTIGSGHASFPKLPIQ